MTRGAKDRRIALIVLGTAFLIGLFCGKCFAIDRANEEHCINQEIRIGSIMSGDASVVYVDHVPHLQFAIGEPRKIHRKEILDMLEGCYE